LGRPSTHGNVTQTVEVPLVLRQGRRAPPSLSHYIHASGGGLDALQLAVELASEIRVCGLGFGGPRGASSSSQLYCSSSFRGEHVRNVIVGELRRSVRSLSRWLACTAAV